jgi:uncharacterized protein (TIGR02145 family)
MKKLLSLLILVSFTIKAQEIKIGTQTWTTKNLDVSKFRNGEAIPLAKTNAEWELAGKNKQAAWCYYENKTANGTKYGKLYNFYAVDDPRGLAPFGYHIPTEAEWTILTNYLGGDDKAGAKMKSRSGWKDNLNGNNTSGFNALPGGCRNGSANFTVVGSQCIFWTSQDIYSWNVNDRCYSTVRIAEESRGYSVRCVKD